MAEKLRILLVGNGGREHALAWKLGHSTRVESILVVPGNGGTGGLPKVQNIDGVDPSDFGALMTLAKEQNINLIVPGPEAPLVAGIEEACSIARIRCFGPSKEAARMEGSKTFSKDFMARHKIPTAEFRNFSDFESAKAYLDSVKHRVVIKASGLAAGKGVILPATNEEAEEALRDIMLKKEFGAAGDEVVIEEFLEGEELSILAFSDGIHIKTLPPAQDHKQIYDGDQGPMTGGMGCYSPSTIATPQLIDEIHQKVLRPTIEGMRDEGFRFIGMLFTGLMITKSGLKVLEYNVRFGDPETQTLLPLLSEDTDLAEIMWACTELRLDKVQINTQPSMYSATVIAVAGGYPGKYGKGDDIQLDSAPSGSLIFHAGTITSADGALKTSGGRVIASTATGPSLKEALASAYRGLETIKFEGMFFRKDIGHRDINRSPSEDTSAQSTKSQAAEPMRYDHAGVSIEAGNDLVAKIKPYVKSTIRLGASGNIGGFGGVFDLAAAGYIALPRLVFGTDGVGTKLLIARAMNKHDTIGIDCVAMNANDLVVQGAEVAAFLDIYSCEKLDVEIASEVIKGVAAGCVQAGCALVGGETAEMPRLFTDRDAAPEDGKKYDLGGTAIGLIALDNKILPDLEGMSAGDKVLGLPSSGCHSNGFSLIRKIIERAGLSYTDAAPWDSTTTVGDSLLIPTRIYVKQLLPAIKQDLIRGMSHITGGGLLENIPRMLPGNLAAEIDANRWPLLPVFSWLKKAGKVEDMEFAKVFNTGIGMVMVVKEADVEKTMMALDEAGETVYEIGELVARKEAKVGCIVKNMDVWN